ncbi:hypothetical protein QFC21_002110 [Naganishia friedmannii]|uniref:Uncharacterized protein n=1 Tax=Naganishia friedmannii TaxID=89922 RepID=A0ACC2W1U7_9TREE|nr:hypothetical protein QFC21_002110 [Naganishia friedmannii]
MVLVAAPTTYPKPICSALVSRQFRPLTKPRIDSLLSSFPKLIPPGSQHTTVESPDGSVRFVYQPFDEVYVVLVTNKGSNILQDIQTLSLLVRLISSLSPALNEPSILASSFELLCAFDEVVSLGYKENVSLQQVRNVLEGESHEEKIQEIIARNKEAEAKEELKRRAKQLEHQRREQQRIQRAQGPSYPTASHSGGFGSSGGGGGGGYSSGGGMAGGYAPVSSTSNPTHDPYATPRTSSPAFSSGGAKPPAFKGTGMKLGAKRGNKGRDELMEALGSEAVVQEPEPETDREQVYQVGNAVREQVYQVGNAVQADEHVLPEVEKESIHVTIRERLSLTLLRDNGGLSNLDLRGDLDLRITSTDKSHLRLVLAPPPARITSITATPGNKDLQFQQHPNVGKFGPGGPDEEKTIALKNPERGFPINQGVGVLRWRLSSKDESLVPININCWPSPRGDGKCDVNIEYELEALDMVLQDMKIMIPLPSGAFPEITSSTSNYTYDSVSSHLIWTTDEVSSDSPSGSLEFVVDIPGDDTGVFYPVQVGFVSAQSLAGVSVARAEVVADGEQVEFSHETVLSVDQFEIV